MQDNAADMTRELAALVDGWPDDWMHKDSYYDKFYLKVDELLQNMT